MDILSVLNTALEIIAIFAAAVVFLKSTTFVWCHPVGWRRYGSIFLILSSISFIYLNLHWIISDPLTTAPLVNIAWSVNEIMWMVGATFLMYPNPLPQVDEDDYLNVLAFFARSTKNLENAKPGGKDASDNR